MVSLDVTFLSASLRCTTPSSKLAWPERANKTLQEYKNILEPIWISTMKLEGDALKGRNGAIWEVLPVFEYILAGFHKLELRYKRTTKTQSHFYTNLQLGIQKLDDYYKLLDDTPVYVAAVVLQPQLKWQWIEKVWGSKRNGKKWIHAAKSSVRSLWQEEYMNLSTEGAVEEEDAPPAKRQKLESGVDRFDEFMDEQLEEDEPSRRTIESHDEYERYIGQPRVRKQGDGFNPISWWQSNVRTSPGSPEWHWICCPSRQ